jgi:hypothetical protein
MEINETKAAQLGMPIGTATHRLRKEVMFMLVQKCGMDICYRCKHKIESAAELSLEHKKAWLYASIALFWDLGNIAFSHRVCNISAGNHTRPRVGHGHAATYQRGCRCDPCKAIKKVDNSKRIRRG